MSSPLSRCTVSARAYQRQPGRMANSLKGLVGAARISHRPADSGGRAQPESPVSRAATSQSRAAVASSCAAFDGAVSRKRLK